MPDGRITLDWDGNIEIGDNEFFLMRKMSLDKIQKVARNTDKMSKSAREMAQKIKDIHPFKSCGSLSC